MARSWWSRIEILLLVAALSACGGGGGGGGAVSAGAVGGATSAASSAASIAPPAGQPLADGTLPEATSRLGGRVDYERVANPTGPLDYAGTANQPVRGAWVDVLDAASDEPIVSTQTDAAGAYSVVVPAMRSVTVRVRAQSGGVGSEAPWDLSVRDNTRGGAVYAIESPAFTLDAQEMTRDLHAASGWAGNGYGTLRAAAPFAILDTLRNSMEKVLSVAPATQFPPLRAYWSVNNVPAYGQPAVGEIGTTSFTRDQSGAAIYVLGKENNDTDEYDASVLTHEWGHYYQDAFGRDDSPGGAHSMADSLDARLAFSEGWGNAWSGIALGRTNYTDALGALQAGGVNIDLTTGPSTGRGWYREGSINAILWQLNARVGFAPIHQVMTAWMRGVPALTDIHAFTAGMFARDPAAAGVLVDLLRSQSIAAVPNDPFGQSEANNGGLVAALPLYRTAIVGGVTRACVSNVFGRYNKLGSFVYLRVEVPSARAYAIRIDGPAGADPDISVYSGRLIARSEGLGTTETTSVNLPAGTTVLAINDANDLSSSTCFNVAIN